MSVEDLLFDNSVIREKIGFFNYRSYESSNLQIFEKDRRALKGKEAIDRTKDRKRRKFSLSSSKPGYWNIGNFIPSGETEGGRTREGRLCGPVFPFNKGDAQ